MKLWLTVCCCVLMAAAYAEMRIYRLSEFGPVGTAGEAKAAIRKAAAALKTGGILVVDDAVAAAFMPESVPQGRLGEPGVFIIDLRRGKLRMVPPSLGFRIPQNPNGYSAFMLDRTIDQGAMNVHGLNSILRISDQVVKGTTSYFQYVGRTEKTGDPETVKVHVPTVKGLYAGLELIAQMGKESVAYSEKRFSSQLTARVEEIGLDGATDHWIILRKTDPAGAWGEVVSLFNKSSANSIMISEVNHADQENFGTISIDKHAYGQGDNFGVGITYMYMGNVMSTRADECGNAYTANIWHRLNSFIGKVEQYDAKTGILQYDAAASNAGTLGTSRPLINLNPKKWITSGKIAVEANYSEGGAIDPKGYVRGVNTGWTPEIVGRFLAVDEPEEYAGNPPKGFWKGALKGRKVRRWWYIRKYEKVNGEDRLWVERVCYTVSDNATPTLINERNYRRELAYIIAPGAMVADVSRGLPDIRKHEFKGDSVKPGVSRLLVLAPGKDGAATFAPGDPVEQAVGADPSHPNGYRVRHREAMPSGSGNSYSFYSVNNGAYPVRAALRVDGWHDRMQVAHHSKYFHIIDVGTSCDYGIRFRDAVKKAALYMEKPGHRIAWKTASGNVALSAVPGALSLNGGGLAKVKSIAATEKAGANLRGIDVKIPAGVKSFEVKFPQAEPDNVYSLTVQPNWLCRWAVTAKTAQGFTVAFDEAANSNSTIDWQMIR